MPESLKCKKVTTLGMLVMCDSIDPCLKDLSAKTSTCPNERN